MPIYAQLSFTNYYTETFIHVINFMGKWPLLLMLHRLIQKNCAVNLSGNIGPAIELNAFVEAEIVEPLKVYVSGMYAVTCTVCIWYVSMYYCHTITACCFWSWDWVLNK
jgi:hypothetical protein